MRVLFAWEMGRNFGHVAEVASVATLLARDGAEVFLALQNPGAALAFVGDARIRLLQAPFRAPRRPAPDFRPLAYPDELLSCGYESAASLVPLLLCWRSLFELVRPDLLVAEAAPTALLAARGMGFARAMLGNGYDIPPPLRPLPALRYWEKPDSDELQRRERAVTATINQALTQLGMARIDALADLLDCEKTFLCTFPELDHYGHRPATVYYRNNHNATSGVAVDWSGGAKRRIFAYLRPDAPVFGACLQALAQLPPGHDAIVAAPGLASADCERLGSARMRVLNQPVRLAGLLARCDLGLNHASFGVCSLLAAHGVPSLMFPQHVEQLMLARAMLKAELGLAMVPQADARQIGAAIGRLLTEGRFRQSAHAFAQRHAAERDDPEPVAEQIARELRELVGATGA